MADRRDDGSALIEFLALGVLLLVPVVYLVLALSRVQAAAFGADGAAREAGRAFVTSPNEIDGQVRALAAVRLGLLDQGFDVDPRRALLIACGRTPCLTPEGTVTAEVSVDVVLPGVPAFVDGVIPLHITVRSRQTAVVDAFRTREES
jgi:hypothetical protein